MEDLVKFELEKINERLGAVDMHSVILAADMVAVAVHNGGRVSLPDDVELDLHGLPQIDIPGPYDADLRTKERSCSISFRGRAIRIGTPLGDGFKEAVLDEILKIAERTLRGNKTVFLDRDDTIAKDVPYCNNPDEFIVFPYSSKAIARLNEAGFKVIVVTNQSGIGRGKVTREQLDSIHDKMIKEIAKDGGKIDEILYCPHHPDDGCDCRKPNIGMGWTAVNKYKINPRVSYVVGDTDKDMGFGRQLGCKCFQVSKDFTLEMAVDEILKPSTE